MKKIEFYTLGCKVNQYETQAIREQLLDAGYREDNSRRADVYVINTCTVTQQADAEARRLIRKAIKSSPKAKIIVTGCYVEKDAQEILQISNRIRILPNQQKHLLLKSLRAKPGHPKERLLAENDKDSKSFLPLSISDFRAHQRAFVKIQDGCNNFCAYCKVPLVRGRSRSRSLQEIVQEVSRLVNNGFKEVVLTGICLGDYHYRKFKLADVLVALEKIEGDFRLRLSSLEPHLIRNRLLEEIAASKKVCPHLHIPLQSADDAILKRMNRQYTQKMYLSLIAKIRKKIKDVAITTDILVGFPGETERNFCNTVRCLERILPLRTHIFPFSPRPGTTAFGLNGRIEPKVIKERIVLLKQTADQCSYKFRKRFLSRDLTVLIESQADKEKGFLCGYSENYIRVIVENAAEEDINSLLPVEIKTVNRSSTCAKKRR